MRSTRKHTIWMVAVLGTVMFVGVWSTWAGGPRDHSEIYGACCDDSTGYCQDNVASGNCLPPLRFSVWHSCEGDYPPADPWPQIDPPCGEAPTGACCVDQDCVETNTEMECHAFACGVWYEGEECPGFECPELLDFGDAPDGPYPTLLVSNGARHTVVEGIHLGATVDWELDGQPDPDALGDDEDGNDDEDGVIFTTLLIPGTFAGVVVDVTMDVPLPGFLDAWIDFNGDGSWAELDDQIFASQVLPPGTTTLYFFVPFTATPDIFTFARFRFGTIGDLAYDGWAPDGEVEDYKVFIGPENDLGDAPDSSNNFDLPMTAYPATGVLASYPTVYHDGSGVGPYGPIHWQPRAVAYLGRAVTLEEEADMGADQDPTNNIDPPGDVPDQDGADDGVDVSLIDLPHCEETSFDYVVTIVDTDYDLYVNVWFDYNRNGNWYQGFMFACPDDPNPKKAVSEWAVQNQLLSGFVEPGEYTISTPPFVPWNPNPEEDIWMRITLSEQPWPPDGTADDGGCGPEFGYQFGETEDYYIVPPTEACCLPFTGECVDVPVEECLAMEGTPQGPGSVCTGFLEACCLEDGTCLDVDPLCCDDLGGTPQGPGTGCVDSTIACCLEDGTCVDVDPICCDDLGGVSQGDGTMCTETEGCCLDDGTCLDVDPLCCDEVGGIAQGAGTACVDMTIACCFDDGSCLDVDPLCCDDLGGWPGYASTCMGDLNSNGIDDACEPQVPQACCLENGTCVEVTHDVCIFVHQGTPQGPDTTCTQFEACCIEEDGSCLMVDPLCCDELGGVPQGPGTVCTQLEACCIEDVCVMVDPLCCDELGGIPQGLGSQCTFAQACCIEDDGTCLMVDPLCCDEIGGVPQGPFSICTEPEGCCLEDGTCLMVDPICCDDLGGTPQGPGTACIWMTVACCLEDGSCTDVDPLCCDDLGGWEGFAPQCLGDVNGNGINDACEEPEPKWSQWPHGPEEGFDAASGYSWYEPPPKWEQLPDPDWAGLHAHDWDDDPYQWITLADDWLCEGGSVVKLEWWGNYELDEEGQEIRGQGIAFFQVSIHTCAPGPQGWCVPLEPPLWWGILPFMAANEHDTGQVNVEGSTIYLYGHDLPTPFPQEPGMFYWFNITAFSVDPADPPLWRWQEAQRAPFPEGPLGHAPAARSWSGAPWESIIWDVDPESYSDLAFRVTSIQLHPEPVNDVVADDFISDGRPIEALRWWGSYLDEQYAPDYPFPTEPYVLDGWFISFHHTEPDAVCPPDALSGDDPTVLGVYFAPVDAVRIDPIDYQDCFGHSLYEYFVDLDRCCLLCSEIDPRNGSEPAQPEAFLETEGFGYWLDIQAVVGVTWDPEVGCTYDDRILTGHEPSPETPDRHFWGWHTSPADTQPQGALEEACVGRIVDFAPYPPDCWDYGDWEKQPWLCPPPPHPVHMAFELLTSVLVPTEACCYHDGSCEDLTPGVCLADNGRPMGPGTDCSTQICLPCPWDHTGDWVVNPLDVNRVKDNYDCVYDFDNYVCPDPAGWDDPACAEFDHTVDCVVNPLDANRVKDHYGLCP